MMAIDDSRSSAGSEVDSSLVTDGTIDGGNADTITYRTGDVVAVPGTCRELIRADASGHLVRHVIECSSENPAALPAPSPTPAPPAIVPAQPTTAAAAPPVPAAPPHSVWNDDHLIIPALAVLVAVGIWLLVRILFRDIRQQGVPKGAYERTIPYCKTDTVPKLADGWQAIVPHAGETFFDKSPTHVYEIEVTGACRCWRYKGAIPADARYCAEHGRFLDRHHELTINGEDLGTLTIRKKPPMIQIIEEDRGAHSYKFKFTSPADSLGIAFGMAWESHVRAEHGHLAARVTPMPDERPQQEAERLRAQQKQEAIDAADEFARAVKHLSDRAQLYKNWADPEYRQRFAEAHHAELIQHQDEIRKEAAGLLGQDRLLAYLRRYNPPAAEVLLGRLDALHCAERVSLGKAIAAAKEERAKQKATSGGKSGAKPVQVLPAVRPRPNDEQVRQYKVYRQSRGQEDNLALEKDTITREESARAWVKSQYGHLADDEQQRMVARLIGKITQEASDDGAAEDL